MTSKKSIIISYIVVAILLTVAIFFDLEINHALYNNQSIFAIIFDYIGEMPIYLGLPFSFGIIFAHFKHETKPIHILLSFASVIVTIGTMFIFIDRFFTLPLIVHISTALILSSLILYFMSKLKKDTVDKLYKFACFAIIVLLASLFLNQAVKYLWGRYRYRDLYKADNFMRFTPWYLPQGINGNKSFPSGHTNSATTMLLLVNLLQIFKISNKKINIVKLTVIIFIICTALSRIIYGAHYLSDVAVGFALCYAVYLVTYYQFYNTKKEVANANKTTQETNT